MIKFEDLKKVLPKEFYYCEGRNKFIKSKKARAVGIPDFEKFDFALLERQDGSPSITECITGLRVPTSQQIDVKRCAREAREVLRRLLKGDAEANADMFGTPLAEAFQEELKNVIIEGIQQAGLSPRYKNTKEVKTDEC